jgi:hypothetical protein
MSELENTQNAQGNDVNPLADIVTRLNSSLGGSPYSYINTGIVGTDTVRVGIIYKPAKVTPIGSFMADNNPVHNRPPLRSSKRTGDASPLSPPTLNRSRSSSSADADKDQGDGQGCFNATRVQQSQALLSFINTVVAATAGDPDVLLVGDFNSYAKEEPIRTIGQAGFTNLVSRYGGAASYSYAFWPVEPSTMHWDGKHARSGEGHSDYHINAENRARSITTSWSTASQRRSQIVSLYNADEFRIADHDPVLIGLSLSPLPQAKPTRTPLSRYDLECRWAGRLWPTIRVGRCRSSITQHAHGPVAHPALITYTPAPGYIGQTASTTRSAMASSCGSTAPVCRRWRPLAESTCGRRMVHRLPVPGSADEFYGLTDRGPNVDGPNGTKVEPLPAFTPSIAKFKFAGSQAILEQIIPLRAADGTPYSGRVNSQVSAGEVITDLNGSVLPADPNGYDPEGLVAGPTVRSGSPTVWAVHHPLRATGKQIGRLSPFDGSLPRELAKRAANRGMESLTITPDGSTLVGAMQSALAQTDLNGFDPKLLTPIRIVTYRLADGLTHEYLYLLDNPALTGTAVSEITALSNTTFLVDERDGKYPPAAYKKVSIDNSATESDRQTRSQAARTMLRRADY